jgi:putative hemolysin
MAIFLYTLGVLGLNAGLVLFSYFDRVYREIGRVTTGRIHQHLERFESEIEPRLHVERRRGNLAFSLLAKLWLVIVAVATTRGVVFFVPGTWEAAAEMVLFLGTQVVLAMFFFPSVLLARASGRWSSPLIWIVRIFLALIWPVLAVLELGISLLHLSEEADTESERRRPADQEALEALMETATEEGILEQDEARLIEQVAEFHDKRVRELMTPRPDIVGIPATSSVDQLRRLLIDTKFSRLPVYEKSLDEVVGIVTARDVLAVSESDATRRTVRELTRPALFVPETKSGSELLQEMRRKKQQLAIAINEYGLVAGVVTVEEDLSEDDRAPVPDVVRESQSSVLLRGSASVQKLQEVFGIEPVDEVAGHSSATLAGLLSSISGHVPVTGETIDYDGLRFEVLEANQRKVLRLRARRLADGAGAKHVELA